MSGDTLDKYLMDKINKHMIKTIDELNDLRMEIFTSFKEIREENKIILTRLEEMEYKNEERDKLKGENKKNNEDKKTIQEWYELTKMRGEIKTHEKCNGVVMLIESLEPMATDKDFLLYCNKCKKIVKTKEVIFTEDENLKKKFELMEQAEGDNKKDLKKEYEKERNAETSYIEFTERETEELFNGLCCLNDRIIEGITKKLRTNKQLSKKETKRKNCLTHLIFKIGKIL